MKTKIRAMVLGAAKNAFEKGLLPSDQVPDFEVEIPKHDGQGDFSTNFAMVSARIQKMAPAKIAGVIVDLMSGTDGSEMGQVLEKIETAGPGFINFFLSPFAWHPVVDQVLAQDTSFGASDIGKGERVQVEFVSANPHRAPFMWDMDGAQPSAMRWVTSFPLPDLMCKKSIILMTPAARSVPLAPLSGCACSSPRAKRWISLKIATRGTIFVPSQKRFLTPGDRN